MSESSGIPSRSSSRRLVNRSLTNLAPQTDENTPPTLAEAPTPSATYATTANAPNGWADARTELRGYQDRPVPGAGNLTRPGISVQSFRDYMEAGIQYFAPIGRASDYQPADALLVAVSFVVYETPREHDPQYLEMLGWGQVADALGWGFEHLEIPCEASDTPDGRHWTDHDRTDWLRTQLQQLCRGLNSPGSIFVCVGAHGTPGIPRPPPGELPLGGPFIISAKLFQKDLRGMPTYDRRATSDSKTLLRTYHCDLSAAIPSLVRNGVQAFVFVDACLSFDLLPRNKFPLVPMLVSAGKGRLCKDPHVFHERHRGIMINASTGHPDIWLSTVTKIAQKKLLETVTQGQYINAVTLSAHLLSSAYEYKWDSAPVLSEVLDIGGTSFPFLPSRRTSGTILGNLRMTPTSANNRDILFSKAARMRQFITDRPAVVVVDCLVSMVRAYRSVGGLLHTIFEVLKVRNTGSCEIEFKIDPGLFYSLPKLPGLEFVEWTTAVDRVRSLRVFDDLIAAHDASLAATSQSSAALNPVAGPSQPSTTIYPAAAPSQPSAAINPVARQVTTLATLPSRPSTESRRSRVDASYSGAIPNFGNPTSSAGRASTSRLPVSTNPRTTANLRPGASVNENERPAGRNQENKPFPETRRKISDTVQKAKRQISDGFDSLRGRPRG